MSNIRVRFAPSPTGYLHVGGLRTALYNFLFARHNGGKMILRIEDTDRTRFVEGAMENLIQTLQQCGIDYDEGPLKGGDFGPYVQSERQEMYVTHAEELLANNNAYKCFCTPQRLEEMRKKQQAEGNDLQYDGFCRTLSSEQIKENEASGLTSTIRLRVPESGKLQMNDLVRGEVEFEIPLLDDQILIKSDGFPTYHLANVVDDHHMQISHVIRGEEWLPSTPKHILLYQAFSWEIPQFAHLPLLLNADRSKLSKRQGDVAVEDYLQKGYLPEALINFVALLGWNPGTEQELISITEMIDQFSIERVNKAGAVFDIEKLNWMNGQYLRNLPDDDYLKLVKPYVKEILAETYSEEESDKICLIIKNQLEYAAQARDHLTVFTTVDLLIDDPELKSVISSDSSILVFKEFLNQLESVTTLDAVGFKQTMKAIQEETGVKGKELFMPVRIALTGHLHGPDLAMTVEIFGKEKIRRRLESVL